MRFLRFFILGVSTACCLGCGTTHWTDTSRTATEQLLLSDSIDRAVSRVDLRVVAGKKVFLDDAPVKATTDTAYLVSTLRQHVLANGGILKDKREDADYVLEVRAGAVGTDHHDLLFGVPAMSLPTVPSHPTLPAQTPEVALARRTEQRGITEIYLFVYNRHSGRPVWQSGSVPAESRAKATWLFGAGPFQRGTIYRGTRLAGDHFNIPLVDLDKDPDAKQEPIAVADEAFFVEPKDGPGSPVQQAKAPADERR